MTVQPPQQFTPQQILDAARRAEAEGRRDFAHQFYRHLLDYYPGTSEALAARDGLMRLNPPEARHGEAFGAEHLSHAPQGYAAPQPSPPSLSAPPRRPAHGRQPHHTQTDGERRRPPHHPEAVPPYSDYRTGRLLARLTTWLGGACALAGAALTPISIVMPALLSILPVIGGYVSPPGAGIALLLVGLAMMLFGQLTRAIMEMANATRDLARVARNPRDQSAAAPHHGRD